MQANKNVIMLRDSDKQQLLQPLEYKSLSELSKLHGDSSDFESDDYEPYIKDLNQRQQQHKIKTTLREEMLIRGIVLKDKSTKERFRIGIKKKVAAAQEADKEKQQAKLRHDAQFASINEEEERKNPKQRFSSKANLGIHESSLSSQRIQQIQSPASKRS